jgi:hypothetical protein
LQHKVGSFQTIDMDGKYLHPLLGELSHQDLKPFEVQFWL